MKGTENFSQLFTLFQLNHRTYPVLVLQNCHQQPTYSRNFVYVYLKD